MMPRRDLAMNTPGIAVRGVEAAIDLTMCYLWQGRS
jgi:hypothetical protein